MFCGNSILQKGLPFLFTQNILHSLVSFFYLKDYLNFKEIILSNVEGIASKTESIDLILYCVLLAALVFYCFKSFRQF